MLYSGGRDGRINEIDLANNDSVVRVFEPGVLPRAIDVLDGKMIVGLRTGSIIEIDMES